MKLPDLLPANDLLKNVEGVESGLQQRQRLGVVGLALAVLQIVVLIANNEWFEGLTTTDWTELFKARWGLLLVLIGVVASLVLAAWSRFWLKESQAPFRYTYSIADFKPVGEDSKEERLAVQLSHDLAQRLNDRIKRLSLLDEEEEKKQAPNPDAKRLSHIHIKGFYLIRRNPEGLWFIELMPRVRIGPPGSPDTLAHVVRFRLPDDSVAKGGEQDNEAKAATVSPPQMTGRHYEQILERVYFSVASEIYKQIQQDVKRKIELLPTNYYRGVALYHEAEDYAASNTLDAYGEALSLYDESLKAFDPSMRQPLRSKFPRLVQRIYQKIYALWARLRLILNHVWPRLGKVELLCARAEIGYASMLYYRRTLASILAQKQNAPFEIRPVALSARNRLLRVSPDVPGRNDCLFDANVTLCLAWYSLGVTGEAQKCLDEALRQNPARADTDPKYIFAAGCLKTNSSEVLQLYQQAVELEPRFDVAQFFRAISMEMDWRRKSVLERNVAELVFREYEELLRTNPGNVGAWSNTGYMRWLLDDAEKAKEAFEVGREYKDIKRETFVAELDYGLARVAAEAGDVATAYQYFESGFSALIARGVAHSARGETAEFYHYQLINKTILDRFERYRQKLEANLKFWAAFDEEFGSFQDMIAALQDANRRGSAIKVLGELLLLTSKRTSVNRQALADWAASQTNPRIKTGLKHGDLASFAEQIKSSFASSWDADFCAQLQSFADRPFANLIDRHIPKKRVRDAVHAFVLEDYGNACFEYHSRTGDLESFEKAKAAYQEAIQLKSDFVLPHYRLYSKIERNDEHIQKVIKLAEFWPDGKLEQSRTEIEKLWWDREKAETDAAENLELANESELEADSLAAKAAEALKNARQKRYEAGTVPDDYVEAAVAEITPEGSRPPAVANFNKQIDLRMMRQPSDVSGNGSTRDTATTAADSDAMGGANAEATAGESKRQILLREAEALVQAAKKYEEEAETLREEANDSRAEAERLMTKASGMEVPEDNLSSKYLKDFLPHQWLWTSDAKGVQSAFNLKALKRKDYAAERKWEREFNSLQVTALLVWAQSRKTEEAVQLFNHLRDHFWPEDFELIRARRRLLKDHDDEKDANEARLRATVKSWLQDYPYSVISYWIGEIFTGDEKTEAYVEASKQSGFSKQCYEHVGAELVKVKRHKEALEAFKQCRSSKQEALLAFGDAVVSEQPQVAVTAYMEAFNSDDPELLLMLGNRLYGCGRTKEAIQSYRSAMNTCDPQKLRKVGQALEERGLWLDSLRAYRRAKASDTNEQTPEQRNYHLLIGRNLLALARQDADVQFEAIGKILEVSNTSWRTAIVRDSLNHISSLESYRLLRTWLEDQRNKCQQSADTQGYRDAFEAILLLSREKYFSLNPKRSTLPSLVWNSDVVDVTIEADAEVFASDPQNNTIGLAEHINEVCQRIEQEMGVPIPQILITSVSQEYIKNSYIVFINDVPTVMGTVQPGQTFFPRYKEQFPDADIGLGAFNPQTGEMDGVWLDQDVMTSLQTNAERGWNQFDFAAQHLESVLRANLTSLLGLEQALNRVASWQVNDCDNANGWRNKLVEKALPDNPAKLRFTQVLQALVKEGVPTTDLETILEEFSNSKKLDLISTVEAIRLVIKDQLPGNRSSFHFLCLSAAFEVEMQRWIWNKAGRIFFAIEPEETQALLNAVRTAVDNRQHASLVIVSHALGIRPFVRRLIEVEFPKIKVLALAELRRDLRDQLSETIEYEN